MLRPCRRSIACAFALLACAAFAQAADPPTIISAARIHTMDVARPHVQAMAFDAQGRIIELGDTAALRKRHPQARHIDVGTATIIPGLIDAHGHVSGLGQASLTADLTGTGSKQDILLRLREFADRNPGQSWLIGRGWDQNDWPEQRFPTAADLDAAFPDRPVWLERVDGHAGWANSAALKRVPRDLRGDWQPEGGRIERDTSGAPTGLLVDEAMKLVENATPVADAVLLERRLSLGMQLAVRHGLTGVHDAGVRLEELRAYQRLADRGELPMRINAMADGNAAAFEALCKNGLYRHASGRLQMRSVKLYADGALGSRGAAMLAPYSDDPGNRGLLVTSVQALAEAMAKAHRCGVQVATHAIGDRGNRIVLDLYARALGDASSGDHRWRIEHAQVLALQDLPRLAQLHVIASMQPTHATSDMPWAADRVGQERIAGAYAWRQLIDSGARMALGSDFPVESVDPRLGLYAAATRADAEGKPAGGWRPQEMLTVAEALRGFTLDAAYAGFNEADVGSLQAGKRADFVVVAQDPLAIEPALLRALDVRATYVDGRPVFEAGGPAAD